VKLEDGEWRVYEQESMLRLRATGKRDGDRLVWHYSLPALASASNAPNTIPAPSITCEGLAPDPP